jgi:hypothetical protein
MHTNTHVQQRLQKATELQTLLSVIYQSDANADHKISAEELDVLFLRLKSFSVVEEARLREAFRTANTQSATSMFLTVAASHSMDENNNSNNNNGTNFDYTFGASDWLFEEA